MYFRRRRANHNEIEKRRREQQRLKLEELKGLLPGLKNEKASFLDIISGAIYYIHQLERNNPEESGTVQANQPVSTSHNYHPNNQQGPNAYQHPVLLSLSPSLHTLPENAILDPFQSYNGPTPIASPKKQSPNKPMAGGLTDLFDLGHNGRRESSILFPTNDPLKSILGKRNSSQHSFSEFFPKDFGELKTLGSKEICCPKCSRGIDNLIMIDCDICQAWYHTRCVGIESTQIPFQWTCPECGGSK